MLVGVLPGKADLEALLRRMPGTPGDAWPLMPETPHMPFLVRAPGTRSRSRSQRVIRDTQGNRFVWPGAGPGPRLEMNSLRQCGQARGLRGLTFGKPCGMTGRSRASRAWVGRR